MLMLAYRVPRLSTQAGAGTAPTLGHGGLDGQVGLLVGGQEGLDAVQRHAGVDDLADELRQLEQRHAQHREQRQRRERLRRKKDFAHQAHPRCNRLADGNSVTPAGLTRSMSQQRAWSAASAREQIAHSEPG